MSGTICLAVIFFYLKLSFFIFGDDMKTMVLGVKLVSGVSTKSGSPQNFEICTVLTMSKVEKVTTEKVTVRGFGFEVSEIRLAPDALEQFASVKFPASLDLETDMVNFRGKLEPIVTGVKVPAAA